MREKKSKHLLMKILLFIYIAILTWIILFKMQFNFNFLPYIRSINLIPFGDSTIVNGRIDFSEIVNNVIAFIPFGVFLGIIWKNKNIVIKLIPILTLTLTYEVMQYILHIGATDITDILMNTLGGIIGTIVMSLIYKVFKNEEKVNKILNILAIICSILIIGFVLVLIIFN